MRNLHTSKVAGRVGDPHTPLKKGAGESAINLPITGESNQKNPIRFIDRKSTQKGLLVGAFTVLLTLPCCYSIKFDDSVLLLCASWSRRVTNNGPRHEKSLEIVTEKK